MTFMAITKEVAAKGMEQSPFLHLCILYQPWQLCTGVPGTYSCSPHLTFSIYNEALSVTVYWSSKPLFSTSGNQTCGVSLLSRPSL